MRAAGVSMTGALAVLALSCSSAYAQAATGLEPGVHIDPGSPAAKEYVLPLNQARQTGVRSSSHGSPAEAQLFGAGIKPPGSGGSKPPGSGGSGRALHGSHRGRVRGQGLASGTPVVDGSGPSLPSAVLRAAGTGSAGGGGSLLALVGGAVAILVLGVFGGTVLRHSRRPAPPG